MGDEGRIPKEWWHYHSRECGTKYRGCAPDCPKDIYERTGRWTGPRIMVRWFGCVPGENEKIARWIERVFWMWGDFWPLQADRED